MHTDLSLSVIFYGLDPNENLRAVAANRSTMKCVTILFCEADGPYAEKRTPRSGGTVSAFISSSFVEHSSERATPEEADTEPALLTW